MGEAEEPKIKTNLNDENLADQNENPFEPTTTEPTTAYLTTIEPTTADPTTTDPTTADPTTAETIDEGIQNVEIEAFEITEESNGNELLSLQHKAATTCLLLLLKF